MKLVHPVKLTAADLSLTLTVEGRVDPLNWSAQKYWQNLSDTDNIVPFKNTTLINLISLLCVLSFSLFYFELSEWNFWTVQCCLSQANKSKQMHPYRSTENKMPCSRGLLNTPMNELDSWLTVSNNHTATLTLTWPWQCRQSPHQLEDWPSCSRTPGW